MSAERPTPWYREAYVLLCVVAALLGLGVVVRDVSARQAKQDLLAAKTEADRLFEGQKYEQALSKYRALLAQTQGSLDRDLLAASEEAKRSRDLAQDKILKEQARVAAEQAKDREREEADRREREAAEAYAKVEQSPEYQELQGQAKKHEAELPGVASRYYSDIVKKFPGTAQASAAEVKARELWNIAYGEQPGSTEADAGILQSVAGGSGSSSRDLCGYTLDNGQTCRNPVKAGEVFCYLHRSRPSSSYSTHVGPRGGVYHYSKNGKKVYHKK